jgi:hypothetical protein
VVSQISRICAEVVPQTSPPLESINVSALLNVARQGCSALAQTGDVSNTSFLLAFTPVRGYLATFTMVLGESDVSFLLAYFLLARVIDQSVFSIRRGTT